VLFKNLLLKGYKMFDLYRIKLVEGVPRLELIEKDINTAYALSKLANRVPNGFNNIVKLNRKQGRNMWFLREGFVVVDKFENIKE
jgi:hypothetical protein